MKNFRLELKKIYRQTNKEFQNKLNKLRKEGVFDFKNKIDPKGAINQKCLILSSTHTDISKLNKLGLNLKIFLHKKIKLLTDPL